MANSPVEPNKENPLHKSPFFDLFVREQSEIELSLEQERNLKRIRDPDALVVTTAQQPSLLGGPLYSYLKTYAAICWARNLEKKLNRSVIPLFWVPGNDSDLLESNHSPSPKRVPDYQIDWDLVYTRDPLHPRMIRHYRYNQPVLDKFFSQIKSVYSDSVFQLLHEFYSEGSALTLSFKKLLSHFFADSGLLFVDGGGEFVQRASQKTLRRVVDQRAAISKSLKEIELAAEKNGQKLQVENQGKYPRVFCVRGESRVRVSNPGNAETLSPDVLTRPVICDDLFPTLLHVLGPSELEYFKQSKVIYDVLNIPFPILKKRPHGLVHLRTFEKTLNQIDIQNKVPPEAELRERLGRYWKKQNPDFSLKINVTNVDPQLTSYVDGQLKSLRISYEKKFLNLRLQKEFDFDKLRFWYGPGNVQERNLPWLWLHSEGLLEDWSSQIKYDSQDFQIWRVG